MAGPERWGPIILGITWSFLILSTFFVAARLYVRGIIQKTLYADDYWTLTSVICGYIAVGLGTAAVINGYGDHIETVSPERLEKALMFFAAQNVPGALSASTPKLAVVALFCRLLQPSQLQRYIMWTLAITTNLSVVAFVGVVFGRCTPARAEWDYSVNGKCFDVNILVAYTMYCGVISALTDFYLAIYPCVVLFGLQMATKKKYTLSAALGLGIISGGLAIWKTTFIPKVINPDVTYASSPAIIFILVEGSVINIATAIPLLKPLAELVMDKTLFSSRSVGRSSNTTITRSKLAAKSPLSTIELAARRPAASHKDLGSSSQEDILGSTMGKSRAWIESNLEEGFRGAAKVPQHQDAGITRTQETQISYK